MRKRGRYIVIEGNDGTGKSTQVELLATYLREKGIESYVPHEPAGTLIADEIRKIIKNGSLKRDGKTNLLLFTAARHEIWRRAKRELSHGKWVISARNYLSTLAYQGVGEGLSATLIEQTTRTFTDDKYMKPDVTIILTLNDQTERSKRIASRGRPEKPDTFESRSQDFQDRVNDAYVSIAVERGYTIIDASRSIEDIQLDIRALLGA
ncbi:MAG TPA: dTMP kinase [Candidatus Saccharimonadaceae bacterium]|nr:dTMP kinase [Candidatus Saccharimonadaceae bacterium]